MPSAAHGASSIHAAYIEVHVYMQTPNPIALLVHPLCVPPHTCRVYTDRHSGKMAYIHPLIEYYRGAVFMDSGGYRQLVKNMQAQPPEPEEVRGHKQQARRQQALAATAFISLMQTSRSMCSGHPSTDMMHTQHVVSTTSMDHGQGTWHGLLIARAGCNEL